MTDTIMVQIMPTSEHKKLKEGTNSATKSAARSKTTLIKMEIASMALSVDKNGAAISSIPMAKGNIVKVNFEKAVNIIRYVKIIIANSAEEFCSNDKVT